jgi:hypothetical protein
MALPGETACREIAPCGAPPFGDIPAEANTQFVQQDFAGVSDGSQTAPWRTIGEAVSAAAPGAIVAIGPGTYAERLALTKPLRLWGLCPASVTLAGETGETDALFIDGGGAGSEIRNLAVTSPGVGIGIANSQAVLEGLWIHDTANPGVVVEGASTVVTMAGSLVENAAGTGVRAVGATVNIGSSVVRGTTPFSDTVPGRGIFVTRYPSTGVPANVTLSGSVVEFNTESGVFVFASIFVMEDSIIHDTLPYQNSLGYGIAAVSHIGSGTPPILELRGSLLERNHSASLVVVGGQLALDRTTIRDTLADVSASGYGIALQDEPSDMVRSAGTITRSLLERSLEIGLYVQGSDLAADSLAIRDTLVRATDGRGGRAMSVEDDVTTGQRSVASLERVRLERNGAFGLIATGSDVAAHRLRVADTLGSQHPELIFGDGVAVFTLGAGLTTIQLTAAQIERSARAGVSNFAASVGLAESTLECNPIQLTSESVEGAEAIFTDQGGNSCGCMGETGKCKITSNGLVPPQAL